MNGSSPLDGMRLRRGIFLQSCLLKNWLLRVSKATTFSSPGSGVPALARSRMADVIDDVSCVCFIYSHVCSEVLVLYQS